jgi:hypothetical protein
MRDPGIYRYALLREEGLYFKLRGLADKQTECLYPPKELGEGQTREKPIGILSHNITFATKTKGGLRVEHFPAVSVRSVSGISIKNIFLFN